MKEIRDDVYELLVHAASEMLAFSRMRAIVMSMDDVPRPEKLELIDACAEASSRIAEEISGKLEEINEGGAHEAGDLHYPGDGGGVDEG